MLEGVRSDIRAALERDPAARSGFEILLCYPGLHALLLHRFANACWRHGMRLTARFVSQFARLLTGIEIHPGATIGKGLFIDHGMGTVIGETAEVGDDCTLYQGVTLGGTGKETGKRHPTLGNSVVVGVGASILGSITVGDRALVGAGSVVLKAVPPDCTVVGIPAKVVREQGRRVAFSSISGATEADPCEQCLRGLNLRFDEYEKRLAELEGRLLQTAAGPSH
jgi:serine O-acetyltransferase